MSNYFRYSRKPEDVIARAKQYKRLYDKGVSIYALAQQFGIDTSSIRNGLLKLGVTLRVRAITPPVKKTSGRIHMGSDGRRYGRNYSDFLKENGIKKPKINLDWE